MNARDVSWMQGHRFRVKGGSVEHVVDSTRDGVIYCECGANERATAAFPGRGRTLCKVASHTRAMAGVDSEIKRQALVEYANWLDSRAEYIDDRAALRTSQGTGLRMQAVAVRNYVKMRFPKIDD